jgi:N6-adenosine-specific RNA methylase IME4
MKDNLTNGKSKHDYATIPFKDLLKYPGSKLADENCHCYLWITNEVCQRDFNYWKHVDSYIAHFIWVKPNFGMRNYFRGSTEQVSR